MIKKDTDNNNIFAKESKVFFRENIKTTWDQTLIIIYLKR